MLRLALILSLTFVNRVAIAEEDPPVVQPDAPTVLPAELENKQGKKILVARYLVDEEKKMAMWDYVYDNGNPLNPVRRRFAIRCALFPLNKKPLQIDVGEIQSSGLVPLYTIQADKEDLDVLSPDGQKVYLKIEDYDDDDPSIDEEQPIPDKFATEAARAGVLELPFFEGKLPSFFADEKVADKKYKHGVGGSFKRILRYLTPTGMQGQ